MERTWLQLMCCALSNDSPHISDLGGAESRQSLGGGKNSSKRFEDKNRGGSESESEKLRRCQMLCEEHRESDQVVDSIFELRIIHVREVAYMRSRAIGG
jgi:hypothetical protein